jgi:hypothetical protein
MNKLLVVDYFLHEENQSVISQHKKASKPQLYNKGRKGNLYVYSHY